MNGILQAQRNKPGSGLNYHNIDAAEMRRRQLLQTACQIVEEEGVEALKPARIGELSGCARTLVYRYFPDRDAILKAIAESFYAQLDEKFAHADSTALQVVQGQETAWAQQFVDVIFSIADEIGAAAVILRATPAIGEDYGDFLNEIYSRREQCFVYSLREYCASPAEIRMLIDSAYILSAVTLSAARRGDISPARARAMAAGTVASLLVNWRRDHTAPATGSNVKEFARSG